MDSESISEIIILSKQNSLYFELIKQLNKDFVGIIDNIIPQGTSADEFESIFIQAISHLLDRDHSNLLNLLYKIDVSETDFMNVIKNNSPNYINKISYIIIKRVWIKIWYKNQYR